MSEENTSAGADEALFRAPMRRAEMRALLYEAHYYLAALALGALPALAFFWAVRKYYDRLPPQGPIYAFSALVMVGLLIVFWSATYYPRSVSVKPGAIGFKMLLGERTIILGEAVEIKTLDLAEVKKTLVGPGFRSLTLALSGAVMVKSPQGRPWVFSLDDPEAFLLAVEKARQREV